MAKSTPSEPTAVILAGDIIKWLIPKVGKFPRTVRYGLGSRLESAHLDVLQAARLLGRMAHEMALFSDKSAVYLAGLQVDLGNQVGAWRKASAETANSSANSAIQHI